MIFIDILDKLGLIIFFSMIIIFLILEIKQENKRLSNNYCYKAGSVGESIVASRLDQLGDEFTVENDVNIYSAQIDHLVINHTKEIIFVIETKYWSGTITGDRNDNYWIQEKYGEARVNPILQNRRHCQQVRRCYPGYKVSSIIVFVRNKNIPKIRSVMGENDVVNYILKLDSRVDLI